MHPVHPVPGCAERGCHSVSDTETATPTAKLPWISVTDTVRSSSSSSLYSWRSTDGALSAGASIISWRGGDSIIKSASGV